MTSGDRNKVAVAAPRLKRQNEGRGRGHNFDELLPELIIRGLPAAATGQSGWPVPPNVWLQLDEIRRHFDADHFLAKAISALQIDVSRTNVLPVLPFLSPEEVVTALANAGIDTRKVKWLENEVSHWLDAVGLLHRDMTGNRAN